MGSEWMDISTLPVRSRFYVVNGGWEGRIFEIDGERVVIAGENVGYGFYERNRIVMRDGQETRLQIQLYDPMPRSIEAIVQEAFEGISGKGEEADRRAWKLCTALRAEGYATADPWMPESA